MSLRGLHFVRDWVGANVDLSLSYPYATKRAQVLASACRLQATSQQISLQEIEDETGDLEEVMMLVLEGRSVILMMLEDDAASRSVVSPHTAG